MREDKIVESLIRSKFMWYEYMWYLFYYGIRVENKAKKNVDLYGTQKVVIEDQERTAWIKML